MGSVIRFPTYRGAARSIASKRRFSSLSRGYSADNEFASRRNSGPRSTSPSRSDLSASEAPRDSGADHAVSDFYLGSTLVLGTLFVRETWLRRENDAPGAAMGVFKASIYYLALIFLAVTVDQLVLGLTAEIK